MTVIASLITTLGLNSSTFQTGLDDATKKLRATQRSFSQVGGQLQKIGAGLSIGITAPIVGIGAAMVGSAREMAEGLAEMQKAAQLSNVTSVEFQRLAFAAKSVGFESDKLADVYKDVNDRVGEFLSTGGGEMKDFFQNIAPKVGVTAEMFRNLSGPQALQLYYNSLQKAGANQQQMVFYMEAMADEASALIPLLQNNGKAMTDLGSKAAVITPETAADLQRYNDAQRQMGEAWKQVTIAVVSSGLLEMVTDLVKSVAAVVAEFGKANPTLLKWGVIAAGAAAALGPVVAGIGTLVTLVGAALPVIIPFSAGLMGLAVAEGTAATATYALGGAVLALGAPIAATVGAIALVVAAVNHWDEIKAVASRVTSYMRDLYVGVKTYIVDRLSAVWKALQDKVTAAKQWFFGLYDAVVGHSYVPDMVDEIGLHMARLQDTLVAPARAATQTAAEAFQALQQRVGPILDRLFPDQARMNQFRRDLADLVDFAKQAGWSTEQTSEAVDRLRREAGVIGPDIMKVDIPTKDPFDIGEVADEASKDVERAWDRVQQSNKLTVESFAGLARDVAGSLGNLVGSIKSGDWLGALQNVLDVIGQIAGILRGNGEPADRVFSTNSWGGARAMGGPVMPGRDYLVGERGPEILRMGGSSGTIVPNHQIGGGGVAGRIIIEEAPGFASRVVGLSTNVSVETVSSAGRAGAMRNRQTVR
jgi:hypothetical protein